MPTPTTFRGLVEMFISYINLLVPMVIALIVLFFFWRIVTLLFGGDVGGDKRAELLKLLGWGVLTLFVAVSVFGLVLLLQSTFNLEGRGGGGGGAEFLECDRFGCT